MSEQSARYVRRCGYCPELATHTVIADGKGQVDVCLEHTRIVLDNFLMPPKVLSLTREPSEVVVVDWSWPPLDAYFTHEALGAQNEGSGS